MPPTIVGRVARTAKPTLIAAEHLVMQCGCINRRRGEDFGGCKQHDEKLADQSWENKAVLITCPSSKEISMTLRHLKFAMLCWLLLAASSALSQEKPAAPATQRPVGRGNRQIVLGPDDKQVFADPPAGFNDKRENIPHGK